MLHLEIGSEPIWVLGDETRLAQIVSNLLHNAIKFTDADGQIWIAARSAPKETIELTMRDTGLGMEPAMLARLFESFAQADRTLDRSRGGLGLGLALVKGLVELHGGTVAASSPGLGK